jgi:hypothetical protein
MNKLCRTIVSLSLVLSGLVSSAQHSTVPFWQIERDAQHANLQIPSDEAAINHLIETLPATGSASGFVYSQPVYKAPRTLNSRFFLVNGLHLGFAALDVGLTQHCIATHRCREGNPLMPSSLAGQAGVEAVLVSANALISYRLKKENSKLWWFMPTVGIGAHTVGAVTGFRYY